MCVVVLLVGTARNSLKKQNTKQKTASNNYGSVAGKAAPPAEKAFEVFNALGAVAFAYNFSAVQLEIQVKSVCWLFVGVLECLC